jgi:hypothetical protein
MLVRYDERGSTMVATVNLPGSPDFDHYHSPRRADCLAWLAAVKVEYQNRYGEAWAQAYLPAQIVSEHAFRQWRGRDGRPACQCET